MTTSGWTPPSPFTSEDYTARMRRVVADAVDAGLGGLLVTPGPELVWLTGYQLRTWRDEQAAQTRVDGVGDDAAHPRRVVLAREG